MCKSIPDPLRVQDSLRRIVPMSRIRHYIDRQFVKGKIDKADRCVSNHACLPCQPRIRKINEKNQDY